MPDNDNADLLKQARDVFGLAGKMGREFYDEFQSRARFSDSLGWDRHVASFEELWNVLLGLQDAMRHPPDGFEKVAEQLNEAARLAKRIRAAIRPQQDPASWPGTAMGVASELKNPGPPQFTAYTEFFPELNTICERGFEAIKHITTAHKLDDPFAFADDVKSKDGDDFTLVDRYPNTMEGHVRFIEFVYLEAREQAEALRQGKYSHASITKQLRDGVKWSEAKRRALELDIPENLARQVTGILGRDLEIGTVEQITELLGPATRDLRTYIEKQRSERFVAALKTVRTEIEQWNSFNSPSETGYLVEPVPREHSLHAAVAKLQVFYGGILPRPAVTHWRAFLEQTRTDNERAEAEADWLAQWIDREIQKLGAASPVAIEGDQETKSLEDNLWPATVSTLAQTAGFRGMKHDAILEVLQNALDGKLPGNPRLLILQSLQDRGCDVLIEWRNGTKHGIQVKSNGDIESQSFAESTIAQIQDSRQHGLKKLYIVLCGDMTTDSNRQKVRSMLSRISSMNYPYIMGIPPERAWQLLNGKDPQSEFLGSRDS